MKSTSMRGVFVAGVVSLLAVEAPAADGQGAFDGLGAHAGMTISGISALGNVTTMGIDWLSNGDMVWVRSDNNYGGGSVPGANTSAGVWLVRNITGTPTVTKIADMFNQPTGVAVGPGDEIMVPDRDAVYRITSLTPANTAANRTRVLDNPVINAWHQWIFTPMYYNGRYYAPYSGTIVSGGPSNTNPSSTYSGAVLSWASNGAGGFTRYAGGLRSPNGSGIGSGAQAGFMLFSDNQGSWEPSCPVHLIRPNRFYGHRQNSGYTANFAQANFENASWPYDPPVAWMLDSDAPGGVPVGIGQSTSQPLYMRQGPYAGDWIVGDINQQGLSRIALDPVNGGTGVNANYNGSVHFFTGGFTNSAINRLSWHPTANIVYVGTASTAGCNWPCAGTKPFYQISFNDATINASFEILSVQSRQNGVELQFSQPVAPGTAVAGSFALSQYNIVRQNGYGAGNNTSTAPAIGSVQISNDHLRVFLQVGNVAAIDRVLIVTGAGIRSEAGNTALLHSRAWFTHNYQSTVAFNPGTTGISGRSPDRALDNHITHFQAAPGKLRVRVDLRGSYTVSLRAFNGAHVEERTGSSPGEFDFSVGSRGVHVLQVRQGANSYLRPVLL